MNANFFEVMKKYFKTSHDSEHGMTSAEFMPYAAQFIWRMLFIISGIVYAVLLYLRFMLGNEDVMYYIYISLPVVLYMRFVPKIVPIATPIVEIIEGKVIVHSSKRSVMLHSFKIIKPGFRYRRLGYFVTSPELPNLMYLNARPLLWIGRKGFWVWKATAADRALIERLQELDGDVQ